MTMLSVPQKSRPLTGRHVLVAILAFFGVVFAMNAVMISLAVGTFRGAEVMSSYRAGREFPAAIEAARAQAARGWAVEASARRLGGGDVVIRFEPRDAAGARILGLVVSARLERPADSHFDHAAALIEEVPGVYVARAPRVVSGQWLLVFEARRGDERLYRSRNRLVLD